MGSGRLAHSLVVVVTRRSPCPVSPDGVNVTEGDLHPHTECLSSLTAFLGQWPCLAPGTATRPASWLVSFQGVERSAQPWARAVPTWGRQWTGEGRAASLAEQRVPRPGRAPDPQAGPDVSTGWPPLRSAPEHELPGRDMSSSVPGRVPAVLTQASALGRPGLAALEGTLGRGRVSKPRCTGG